MVNNILEQQQQIMLMSQKERSRDRAAAAYSSKGAEEKGERLSILDIKELVLEARNMFFRR